MSSEKRPYELKARAERQSETRRRIVEATAALHEEVGPARTTIAAIARRAGVQRLTVYSHFPEEEQLYAACQAHVFSLRPPPDLVADGDPRERLRAALLATYGWYRDGETILAHVLHDRGSVPPLDRLLARTSDERLARAASELAGGFGSPRARPVIRLALDFWTWRRLKEEGLDDAAAAELMVDAVVAQAGGAATSIP